MDISVATPSYNCLPGLRRCVGSVAAQKGGAFSHHVQDGASTDGTPEWLAKQDDVDGVSEQDDGMYDAINRAWSRSDGDILSWLNADEQYLPGTLAAVREAFEQHPEWDMLFGDAIITLPEGQPIAARREIPLRRFFVLHGMLYSLSCTLFFRRHLWEKEWLPFDTTYKYLGDYDLILRLLSNGVRCGKIDRYLSLFSVDGTTLSLRPDAMVERNDIQQKYKAGGSLMRAAAKAGRSLERLARGCYRSDELCYPVVLDENGTQHTVGPIHTGFRFTYAKALERLKVEDSP